MAAKPKIKKKKRPHRDAHTETATSSSIVKIWVSFNSFGSLSFYNSLVTY